MLKYGIIGFGNAGKVHAKVVSRFCKNAKLTAICDISPYRRQEAEDQYSIKTYDKVEEFYKMVDCLSICTPHNTHTELAINSINQNKAILIEKPVTLKVEDAINIEILANKKNVVAGTIFQHRFEPLNQEIKSAIENGYFGRILSTSIIVKWSKDSKYYLDWKGDKNQAGGGVLINQAIHFIDLISWFNNGITEVYTLQNQHRKIEVEDNAIAMLKFSNGAFGIVDCSTSVDVTFGSTIEIVGTKHSLKTHEGLVLVWGGKGIPEIELKNKNINKLSKQTWEKHYFGYGHIYQIKNFISSVIKRTNPLITIKDGIATLNIILSMYESMKTLKFERVRNDF